MLLLGIPPSANTKQALDVLLAAINNLQTAYPDGIFIIAGDFNQANLETVLPKFRVAKQDYMQTSDRTYSYCYFIIYNYSLLLVFLIPKLRLSSEHNLRYFG